MCLCVCMSLELVCKSQSLWLVRFLDPSRAIHCVKKKNVGNNGFPMTLIPLSSFCKSVSYSRRFIIYVILTGRVLVF